MQKILGLLSKAQTVLRQQRSFTSTAPCGTRFENKPKYFLIPLLILFTSITVKGEPIQKILRSMSLGAELGGSINFMVTDTETHANGMGLGSHWGFYTVTNRKNTDWNFKLRLESIGLHEEAWSNSEIKSMDQDWFMIGFGVENRTDKKSHMFFWEADLGFAMGGTSEIFTTATALDPATDGKAEVDTVSSFYLGGGIGFKKRYQNRFTIFASLRTFFVFAQPYDEPGMSDRSFYPIPFLFSLGTEYQL